MLRMNQPRRVLARRKRALDRVHSSIASWGSESMQEHFTAAHIGRQIARLHAERDTLIARTEGSHG